MQQQVEPFFSNDMDGWIKVLGFALTIALVVWGAIKARMSFDAKMRADIDGVGGRVANLEQVTTALATKADATERFKTEARLREDMLLSRVGSVEEAQKSIELLIRQNQEVIRTQVQEIKDAVTGEQTRLRERVVKLETVSELRRQGRIKDSEHKEE